MNNTDFEKVLDVLEPLNDALAVPNTLDEGLRKIVDLTCQLMDSSQAAFLLLDEEKQRFIIRAAVGLENSNFREGEALMVPDRLQNILWKLRNIHQINWIDSGIDGIVFPIIAMPIYFKGRRIGHLITGGVRDAGKAQDPLRRKVLALLAPFASLIIENAKATDLISQHFTLKSHELLEDMRKEAEEDGGQRSTADQLMVTSIRNPGKVVRLLSESFYRELTRAGFGSGQVMQAAAHLLECIVKSGEPASPGEEQE